MVSRPIVLCLLYFAYQRANIKNNRPNEINPINKITTFEH